MNGDDRPTYDDESYLLELVAGALHPQPSLAQVMAAGHAAFSWLAVDAELLAVLTPTGSGHPSTP